MNVESLVHRLGICSIYRGYSFLIYAVELAVKNEEYLLYITKDYIRMWRNISIPPAPESSGRFVRSSPPAGMKETAGC